MSIRSRLLAAIIAILFLLSITACEGKREENLHTDTLEPPTQKVELVIEEVSPPTPRLVGEATALDTANENISKALANLFTAVSNMNETSIGKPTLSYVLMGENPKYKLDVSIGTPVGSELYKLVLDVDVETGEVFSQTSECTKLLDNPIMFSRILKLAIKGFNLPIKEYNQTVKYELWIETLVQAYENIAGREIDVDGIADIGTLLERKAMVLDLINPIQIEYGMMDSPVQVESAVVDVLKWHELIRREFYYQSTQPSAVQDAWDLIELCGRLYDPDMASQEVKEKVEALINMNEPLTRIAFSKLLVVAEEHMSGKTIDYGGAGWKPMTDTRDSYAEKAETRSWLFRDAVTNCFYPDEKLQLRQIYSPLSNLVQFMGIENIGPEGEISKLSVEEMISITEVVADCFDPKSVRSAEEKIVLNERSYPWYVDQLETGEHGFVNCVPSSMEMAMKWRDANNTVTTKQLREEYFCDGQGWYDVGLTNQLERHKVPFTLEWDISLERMMEHLDKGNLLIVMYRRELSTIGHAVVVKGYRKTPAGVWIICNDPASLLFVDKYGKPDGIGSEKEGQELIMQIKSHALWYVVIPPMES